ncbi:competence type IV pilus minor pilin ComGE [Streptococcus ovis]|uniref:competence type IV pilus minor pilin ComGE n=1 Tax=Streptococcus ovis TaxID=82806 RepID=UPI00047548FC|nr:competence type IV pilus minor pilin ComGE [Streptococcus ovis]
MVDIKKQSVNAYILLESLVTLSVFAMITSLLLTSVIQGRKQQLQDTKQQEVLNVAKMAVQTGQSALSLNGVHVDILRNEKRIQVVHEGKVVLDVEKE